MNTLRIGILFYLSVVTATATLLVLNVRPDASLSYEREASVRGFQPIEDVMSEARPCGRRADTLSVTGHAGFDSPPSLAEVSDFLANKPLIASDLPGIVKLEPETDLSQTEIAKGHCSATRIARNWFVTAAHCVSNGYDRIVLKVGDENLGSEIIRTVPVDYAVCHAGFQGELDRFDNDLSLLRISEDNLDALKDIPVITWGATSQPFAVTRFQSARVGGWGLKSYGGELNNHLQKMELDILNIEKKTIRLASRAGRGPCVGDSGGPLMVEDDGKPVLMGVLSTISSNRFGEMCAGNYVSNYTNLSAFRGWAFNTMAICDAQIGQCRTHEPGS